MKNILRTLAAVAAVLCIQIVSAPRLSAQITNAIQAHVDHTFIVGDKTLPPGDYTFRMQHNTDQEVMTVENRKGDNVAQFIVRQSVANHTPKHTELVFNRYGNTEFLTKVYEGGNLNGVAVVESSKQEVRLMQGGQKGMEHTEEQP